MRGTAGMTTDAATGAGVATGAAASAGAGVATGAAASAGADAAAGAGAAAGRRMHVAASIDELIGNTPLLDVYKRQAMRSRFT